jgi:NitT/TauT family transport system substrate-binding protein
MDPQKEVTVIQVATPLQIQALQAGQFDALFTIEPYATIGIEQGVAKVLEENPRVKYLLAPFPAGVNAFNQSFIEKYPQAVKKIYAAMIKAVDFIRTNEADAKKFLPKYTPVEAHIAEKSNIYQWWKAEETDVDNLQAYADLLQRLNLLPKRVRVEPMVLKRTQLQ